MNQSFKRGPRSFIGATPLAYSSMSRRAARGAISWGHPCWRTETEHFQTCSEVAYIKKRGTSIGRIRYRLRWRKFSSERNPLIRKTSVTWQRVFLTTNEAVYSRQEYWLIRANRTTFYRPIYSSGDCTVTIIVLHLHAACMVYTCRWSCLLQSIPLACMRSR